MDEEFHDRMLMERVAAGDRVAFTALYTRHLDNLFGYVYLFTKSEEESEEVVQKVFVNIWEHRDSLIKVKSFKGFIFRCAKNRLIDLSRSERAKAKMVALLQPLSEESEERSDSHLIVNQCPTIWCSSTRRLKI